MNKMTVPFLTLDDLYNSFPSLQGRKILLRLDLNMPMTGREVTDSTRLHRSRETIQELLTKQAKVIILSHFGRPQGKDSVTNSLLPISMIIHHFFNCPILFGSDCIGSAAKIAIHNLSPGGILLLENLRFHKEEEKNDPQFAKKLAQLGDIYVNDAFSCCHRAHASIAAITDHLPSYAGRALEKEVRLLKELTTSPQRPLMAIIGGAKVSTKLALLENLVSQMDYLVLGGGIANTFLAAQGMSIGNSLHEPDLIETAQKIIAKAQQHHCQIILPQDVRVSADIHDPTSRVCSLQDMHPHEKIFDIGIQTARTINRYIQKCKTIVWNGPLGVFEDARYAEGSIAVAKEIAKLTHNKKLMSIAGGGETLALLEQAKISEHFSYTSTAGGAFLEWLEGKELPGIVALRKATSQGVALDK